MNQLKSQLLESISHPIGLISLGLIPCLLALTFIVSSQKNHANLKNRALDLKNKKEWSQLKQKKQQMFLSQLRCANRDYLEKDVENIQFLRDETYTLQALVHSEPNNQLLKKRLDFLQSGENRLTFKEQNFQRLDNFQEVEAILDHPVEMNQDDLFHLLSKIENVRLGEFFPGKNPPDLIIRKFELTKKPLTSNEEHFVVNLEIIKRECFE